MHKGGFVSAYLDFTLRMPGPLVRGKGLPAASAMIAEFKLDADVSVLVPYINAIAKKAVYYEKARSIKFILDDYCCTLHENEGSAGAFSDREQALEFMERLIAFLNDIHLRKDSIKPQHKRYTHIPVLDVFRLLPRTNCRKCGFATCMAFAAALSRRQASPHRCPGFSSPISVNAVYPVLDGEGNLLSTVSIDLDTEADQPYLTVALGQTGNRKGADRSDMGLADRTGNGDEDGFLGAPLTGRELSVLRLMARGATNTQISGFLGISPHTVKSHVVHIFNKLGVNDRTQASVLAARHNFL